MAQNYDIPAIWQKKNDKIGDLHVNFAVLGLMN